MMLGYLCNPLPVRRFTASDLLRVNRAPRLRNVSDREVARALRHGSLRWAIQDDAAYLIGTSVDWSDTGTKAITLNGLTSGSIRQGVKSATLVQAPSGLSTAVMPDVLRIRFVVQFNTAPAAGGEVQLYFGFSDSATAGTHNPAGLSGTDATGPNVDTLPQLTFCGSLVASNNIGASADQTAWLTCIPLEAYLSPVVYNNSSVTLKASNNTTVINVEPWYRVRST